MIRVGIGQTVMGRHLDLPAAAGDGKSVYLPVSMGRISERLRYLLKIHRK